MNQIILTLHGIDKALKIEVNGAVSFILQRWTLIADKYCREEKRSIKEQDIKILTESYLVSKVNWNDKIS